MQRTSHEEGPRASLRGPARKKTAWLTLHVRLQEPEILVDRPRCFRQQISGICVTCRAGGVDSGT